jgi:hypothetical protein
MAFLGLVIQPIPRGALKPRLCAMIRLTDVRAAIRLLIEGMRNPNFIFLVFILSFYWSMEEQFANLTFGIIQEVWLKTMSNERLQA